MLNLLTFNESVENEEQASKLSPWAVIEDDESDYPHLPDKPVNADPVVVRTVIRDFVKRVFGILSLIIYIFNTNMFCLAFYTGSSTVHWKDIEKNPHKFFKPASIPNGVDIVIKEPSRMTNLCANGLYHFWFKKQENGKRPLQVLRELRAAHLWIPVLEKKTKTSNTDGDEDEESMEKPEMDKIGTKHLRKTKKADATEASEESPAGTQHSHQKFLKTLSSSENYQQSLALMKYAVSFTFSKSLYLISILQNTTSSSSANVPASWATWRFSKKYLPKEFFVEKDHPDNLQSFVSWIKTQPWINTASDTLYSRSSIEQILLGLGLALRQYDQAHFTHEDDLPSDFPAYGHYTTMAGYDSITQAIAVVLDDIERSEIVYL